MSDDANRPSLDRLIETPAALVRFSSLEVIESNAAFDRAIGSEALPQIIAGGDEGKLRMRLMRRGVYRHTAVGDRSTGRHARHWVCRRVDDDLLLIEGHDDSRAEERDALVASYARMIQHKTDIAERERDRAESLLLNVLPQRVVDDLQKNGESRPERFDSVSVLFLDFVNFTKMAANYDPDTLFTELNEIYTRFDLITEEMGCERIKTMGDAYLAVCGMPVVREDHAHRLTRAGLAYLSALNERNRDSDIQWHARVGIHSGTVIGGIVGIRKYIYDVFGDTINVAARMESLSKPMRLNVSAATAELLGETFRLSTRPPTRVKGKGEMQMFFVDEVDAD